MSQPQTLGEHTDGSAAMRISNLAVQLLRTCTGRGPTKAKTIIRDGAVMVLLEDTLTRGERSLVEAGRGDYVLSARHEFQKILGANLVSGVEEITGRTVVAFMSDNHLD